MQLMRRAAGLTSLLSTPSRRTAAAMAFWYRTAASLEWHTTCALKPFGQDVVDVVVHQVARDGLDALLGFEDVAGGAVLLLDGERSLPRCAP